MLKLIGIDVTNIIDMMNSNEIYLSDKKWMIYQFGLLLGEGFLSVELRNDFIF
jgi:hypothetical protein